MKRQKPKDLHVFWTHRRFVFDVIGLKSLDQIRLSKHIIRYQCQKWHKRRINSQKISTEVTFIYVFSDIEAILRFCVQSYIIHESEKSQNSMTFKKNAIIDRKVSDMS